LDTIGEFVASRPALIRRLAINVFVLMAVFFLMLARTSPALAADNSHGQGKAQDRTTSSAVVQRHDSPGVSTDQQIGGSGGGDGGKAKTKGGGGSSPAPGAPAPKVVEPQAKVQVMGSANAKPAVTIKANDGVKDPAATVKANGSVKAPVVAVTTNDRVKAPAVTAKASDSATVNAGGNVKASGNGNGKLTVVAASGTKKETGENNSDSRGDVAGGKTGNGDDKTKVDSADGASTGAQTTGSTASGMTTGVAGGDNGSTGVQTTGSTASGSSTGVGGGGGNSTGVQTTGSTASGSSTGVGGGGTVSGGGTGGVSGGGTGGVSGGGTGGVSGGGTGGVSGGGAAGGSGGVSAGGAIGGFGGVSGATATSGTTLANTGAPIGVGVLGAIMVLVSGIGLRLRRRR
jgi:hypothetical protein